MRKVLTLGAGLVLAASLASPAGAQALCAGTSNTGVVCVDPTGGTPIDDCVYVGPPPCIYVSIPTPSISCGGDVLAKICASINYLR